MQYILPFSAIGIKDTAQVGGKTASLGQMYNELAQQNIQVPNGFAVTAAAYWRFIEYNQLKCWLHEQLQQYAHTIQEVERRAVGAHIRSRLMAAELPPELQTAILQAYTALSGTAECAVAVRSSATAEDLPGASFAGQHESFLNVQGKAALLKACKGCFSSLFTDRALAYRTLKGFDHFKVALAICVQKMVDATHGSSGVSFSCDTETGNPTIILINAAWGLGESSVQGTVIPDEYRVCKPLLKSPGSAIIDKKLGTKKLKMIFKGISATEMVPTTTAEQTQFCLDDAAIRSLASMVATIEEYYSAYKKQWSPMDIEWAQDGRDKQLYIIQARPETVHALKQEAAYYSLQSVPAEVPVVRGQSIGQKIVTGRVRIITAPNPTITIAATDIIVTKMTAPDWLPLLKSAAGIITQEGGRTCHAAIVARELGIPAVVGAQDVLQLVKEGELITLDCSDGQEGKVYRGQLPFEVKHLPKRTEKKVARTAAARWINCAEPSSAAKWAMVPGVDGVGLARIEFIIATTIQVHPLIIARPDLCTDMQLKAQIDALASGYINWQEFFVERLAYGISTIAGAFYPRPVIVRFSDFKSNEYRALLGGSLVEEVEENPMLGVRGASRYYLPFHKPAFELECKAYHKALYEIGLDNIKLMVPFVRTVDEAKKVLEIVQHAGLLAKNKRPKIGMMVELPANVLELEEYTPLFDFFSIGSNDLTQCALGIDRDNKTLAPLYDEMHPVMLQLYTSTIEKAKAAKKEISICGQGPSDKPELASFLYKKGITAVSFSPDALLKLL